MLTARSRLLIAFVGIAVTVLAGTGMAAATPAEKDVESHCVIDVIGENPDGEFIVSGPRCYSTFAEAVSDASSGQIRVSAGTEGTALFENSQLAVAYSTFTLGTHFDGANGTGSSISIVGSSCSGGYWNTGTSWANRISSTWNGCARLRHYDNSNKAGSFEDTYGAGTTDNLGVLNNRAESVSYNAS